MHSAIQVRQEPRRGCGWRKTRGKYLVSGGESIPCGKLPIPIEACPVCSHTFIGSKSGPSRGWTWVDLKALAANSPPCEAPASIHEPCILNEQRIENVGKVGLLWVGVKHYPTLKDFNREAEEMGISRRVHAIPRGFVLGETWIALGHQRAIIEYHGYMSPEEIAQAIKIPGHGAKHTPAIFRLFKPTAIEVIVDGTESDEEIEALVEKGFTPVKIKRVEDSQPPLLLGDVVDEEGNPLPPGPSLGDALNRNERARVFLDTDETHLLEIEEPEDRILNHPEGEWAG